MSFFEKASSMSEEQIQIEYNCDDTKDEFLDYLQEEINACDEQYQEALQIEENESNWETAGLDPAFSSWKDVYAMFI